MDDDVLDDVQFHEMGLDDRLLKAIHQLNWMKPTDVQKKAIPLALNGKDLLLQSRTGSGKTAAYAIPIIQNLLDRKKESKDAGDDAQQVSAIILVPSRELSQQANAAVQQLTTFCRKDVTALDVSVEQDVELLRPALTMKPDIVIGTASRILQHIRARTMDVSSSLQWLVVDEADLLFTYGYEKDLKTLLPHFNNTYQAILMSATFTEDVDSLRNLVLRDPVSINMEENAPLLNRSLSQFYLSCDADIDKYLFIYSLLKLNLIEGKCLVFVNSINTSYRLKLFLEQFGISSCVLNSELPANSRFHTVEQFNQGLYRYVIATDESSAVATTAPAADSDGKVGKRQTVAKNYSTSRGMDFQMLDYVLNFDFPRSIKSYIHRVGRTARADRPGSAISFVTNKDEEMLAAIQSHVGSSGESLRAFEVNMEDLEGFRYRCQDAKNCVTTKSIKQARIRELKREMLQSKKLKDYFKENPRDLAMLRHDVILQPAAVQPHLRNVPDYLVPDSLKSKNKQRKETKAKKRSRAQSMKESRLRKFKKRKKDPLRSFKYDSNS